MQPEVSGIVGIAQHEVWCIIGLNPEERTQSQRLLIDLKVRCPFTPCLSLDRSDATLAEIREACVDYTRLASLTTQVAQEGRYFLLETLADRLLHAFFVHFPIEWGWVRLHKPAALPSPAIAYVELERKRTDIGE